MENCEKMTCLWILSDYNNLRVKFCVLQFHVRLIMRELLFLIIK